MKQVIVCWFVICFYGNQIKISVTYNINKQSAVHGSVHIKMSTPISHSITYSIKLSLHDLKEAVFNLTVDFTPVQTCRLACNERN
jgi:hypothetical protein